MYSKAVVSYFSMDNETKAQGDSVSLWILCDILYIVFDINQTSFHLYYLRPEASSTWGRMVWENIFVVLFT